MALTTEAEASASPGYRMTAFDKTLVVALLLNLLVIRYFRSAYGGPLELLSPVVVDVVVGAYSGFRLFRLGARAPWLIVVSACLAGIVVLLNLAEFGLGRQAASNLVEALSPVSLLLFLAYLTRWYGPATIVALVRSLRGPLNIYFWLNGAVIVVQVATQSFLLGRFLAINSYVPDHIDGLIGLNGVSVLNFVWIATVIVNLAEWRVTRSASVLAHVALQIAFAAYISTQNDNKMFLPTFLVFGAAAFVIISVKLSPSRLMGAGTLAALAVAAVALFAPSLAEGALSSRALQDLTDTFIYSHEDPPRPDNERAVFNFLAFENYDASSMGIGLNNVQVQGGSVTHEHLGINSASLTLIQGGLVLLGGLSLLYASVVTAILGRGETLPIVLIIGVTTWLSVLTAAYASQPFSDHYLMTALTMCYLAIYALVKAAPASRNAPHKDLGAIGVQGSRV